MTDTDKIMAKLEIVVLDIQGNYVRNPHLPILRAILADRERLREALGYTQKQFDEQKLNVHAGVYALISEALAASDQCTKEVLK